MKKSLILYPDYFFIFFGCCSDVVMCTSSKISSCQVREKMACLRTPTIKGGICLNFLDDLMSLFGNTAHHFPIFLFFLFSFVDLIMLEKVR